jgi:hypothetical protein
MLREGRDNQMKEQGMIIFKLSQQVTVGLNHKEWVDILSDQNEVRVRDYALRVKIENPCATLGLRMVTEKKLELGMMQKVRECNLPNHNICCCVCQHHKANHHHPLTTGKSMSERKGWICTAPELQAYFSGWPEHGICEMFVEKE